MKAISLSSIYMGIVLAVTLSACSKMEEVTFIPPDIPTSNPITSDTIPAFAKGTLLANHSYTILQDVTVKAGDTLLAQPGVTVKVMNNSQIIVQGVLKSVGTKDQPVSFNSDTKQPGSWGGFKCDLAQAVTILWTRVENTGGPDPTGSARPSLTVKSPIVVDIEDSWFSNGQDDNILVTSGAKVTIVRNTITSSGKADGEGINLKGAVTGDVAYNVVFSQAGTGIKLETSKSAPLPQTIVNIYNNTLLSNGWRRGAAEPGRGVSIGLNAIGHIYNNIIVNCYQGIEIFGDADAVNTTYGNNLFYATAVSYTDNTVTPTIDINLRQNFYPSDGVGKPQASDLISTSVGNMDPLFKSFTGVFASPNGAPLTADLTLQASSPAIGKGNAKYNVDLGAYTTDGKGNQHTSN
ncbi:parallel beta helix pectate lyase-like protein [Chitinophaga niastensis]|uniref:Parallel beta helix pectate lyase-like protein n=1 Tax=Chitinophaga niastensis TaxID=536980 RepID=A0A2P8HP02_CHINA|nr:right-handed parallel beta-helix repeat-containing protein [Chitinophaga niastensis]PSL47941.1 parallel beta helix pectate lyase-like protein [Chitinophaga niastensis]